MFHIFLNKKTKILSILGSIVLAWLILVYTIYDASNPEQGVTGALIQGIKSNPELEKNFSQITNPPVLESTPSAAPATSSSSIPYN